jgi:3-deoxy-7-phosphoheptulonate synthase
VNPAKPDMAVKGWQDTAYSEPLAEVPLQLEINGQSTDGILISAKADSQLINFDTGEDAVTGGGYFLNINIANRYKVHKGDDITLKCFARGTTVEKVLKVQEPFKKSNRKFHPENTIIKVGNVNVGGKELAIIAGPCSVESEDQIIQIALQVKNSGANMLRGGAFKPRTSPYAFQGLRAEGLMLLKRAGDAAGLPIVSEITNPNYIEIFNEYVDLIQVGARNMQNFSLLREVGKLKKPVILKRGLSNTIEELLMAAEYILSGGTTDVILCERGIRTFETSTRNTLDLSAVPVLKSKSHLPVIVDPSHGTGYWHLVEPLTLAAVAVGADGLIIEVHNCPECALCDGQQSIKPERFKSLMESLTVMANMEKKVI